jgi:hypothetical protein
MSGGVGQCPARGFCEDNLNSGLTRVGPDNVQLGVAILDGLETLGVCSARQFSLYLTRPS